MMNGIDSPLARKIRRATVDLAPEDEVIGQAAHTAVLRDDDTYVGRWVAHEISENRSPCCGVGLLISDVHGDAVCGGCYAEVTP